MKSFAAEPDGRATRWAAHRAQRRKELLRKVRHAIAENGDGLSMEQISTLTQTSKPVLYRYFTDRAGLQAACGEWAMAKIEQALLDAAAGAPREPGDAADHPSIESATVPTSEPARRPTLGAMVRAFVGLASGAPYLYRFCTVAVAGNQADGFLSNVTELLCANLHLESVQQRWWAWGAVGFVRSATEHWLDAAGASGPAQTTAAASPAASTAADSPDAFAEQLTDWLTASLAGAPPPAATTDTSSPTTAAPFTSLGDQS